MTGRGGLMTGLPDDLLFTAEHEWVRSDSSTSARVGVTAHLVAELGGVDYVSLPTVGMSVLAGDSCGELESTKPTSEIFEVYAPVSGIIVSVNEAVTEDPELLGEDPYGDGWLFDIELTDQDELSDLLDADAYAEQLDE